MEERTTPRGFSIRGGKIPILLTLKRLADLKPHEETVETDLQGMVKTLERDPVLRHPIIADSTTGAVLDGTHRLAALNRLGCHTIPAALIDYQNPLVRVDRWFRAIVGESLHNFVGRVERLSPTAISASEADPGLLSRSSYATLRDALECFTFRSKGSTPVELFRQAFALEQIERENLLKIAYTDSDEIKDLSESSFLMSTIRLSKSEVVESCLGHFLFPPKSTRHLIPSRPLGVRVPLRWLKDTNIQRAESEFEKHLKSKRVRKLPEGSMVGSRRYMEEVFLFE